MYRDTCIGDTVSRIGIAKVVFQSIAYRYRFSPISMYRLSVSLNANLEYRAHHCLQYISDILSGPLLKEAFEQERRLVGYRYFQN